MNSHVCEVGEYMDERYGQVTCDVARDESSPSQHWRVHRQYPAHVVTPSSGGSGVFIFFWGGGTGVATLSSGKGVTSNLDFKDTILFNVK